MEPEKRQVTVTVTGKPGVGKTTFAAALANWVESQGGKVVYSVPAMQGATSTTVSKHFEEVKQAVASTGKEDGVVVDFCVHLQDGV